MVKGRLTLRYFAFGRLCLRRPVEVYISLTLECRYYIRYLEPWNTDKAVSRESEKYWLPVDLYVGKLLDLCHLRSVIIHSCFGCAEPASSLAACLELTHLAVEGMIPAGSCGEADVSARVFCRWCRACCSPPPLCQVCRF